MSRDIVLPEIIMEKWYIPPVTLIPVQSSHRFNIVPEEFARDQLLVRRRLIKRGLTCEV
jgi:hypothetical protein